MKAVTFHEFGGVEVFRYEDVVAPEPGPGEVLIRVGACSVNRLDMGVRATGFGFSGLALPHVCGADPAGEVVAVGDGVSEIAVGDHVATYPLLPCGACDFCRQGKGDYYCRNYHIVGVHVWGGYAEYTKIPAYNAIKLPESVSDEMAAALSLSYMTAWHGIVTSAGVGPEDTVLVMAAGSGVGAAALQIAKLFGARVIAAAGSSWKLEKAMELGADAVVNYTQDNWEQRVRELTDGKGVSVIFDTLGQATWSKIASLLGRDGRITCCGITTGQEVQVNLLWLYRNLTNIFLYMLGTRQELERVIALAAEGRIQPVIGQRLPLSEAARAHRRLLDRANFGKIVLIP
jgi:NADPH:quinone reductase-like Zn-dependent oxidoreductase